MAWIGACSRLCLRVPGTEELSHDELVALLVTRDARIGALLVQVGDLTAQVQPVSSSVRCGTRS